MFISITEEEPEEGEPWPKQIPWELLQAITIIQLYLEERWVEPAEEKPHPFSLLYYQTLGTLASLGELTPSELAGRVLRLSPFKAVSKDDYRLLLHYLIEIEHIEQTPEGGLIVGIGAERIVNHYSFLAVFKDRETLSVKDGSNEIGSVDGAIPVGERFRLAGRTWQVKDIDLERKTLYVFGVRGKATISWQGESGPIHTRILQRMREVLLESTEYAYLQDHARARLAQARKLAQHVGIGHSDVLPLGGQNYCILPWLGTRAFNTLVAAIKSELVDRVATSVLSTPSRGRSSAAW